MRKGAVALICLMAVAHQAYGKKDTPLLFGAQDCGQWLANPNKAYVAGFLSGMNISAFKPGYDPLTQINSLEQAVLWVNNHCKKNPLDTTVVPIFDLYIELSKREKQTSK